MRGEMRYQAHMLRLWPAGPGADRDWRASLQNVHTGEKAAFADLESLSHHLRTITGSRPDDRERGTSGATEERRVGRETGDVTALYFEWITIVLLLAALLISLYKPARRAYSTSPGLKPLSAD